MTILHSRSSAYKTVSSLSAAAYMPRSPRSSGLASVFGSLIGGTTPVYKTLDGQSKQTPASSGLLKMFVGASPSYKTAPSALSPELAQDEGVDAGDVDDVDIADIVDEAEVAGDACDATYPLPPDTIVLL